MTRFPSSSPALMATLVVCLVCVGCTDRSASDRKNERAIITNTYIFVDRSDPTLEYAYIIGQQGVFAQVSTFPGYANKRFFLCPQLPEQLVEETRKWQEQPGEVKPPLIPDGPLFSRTTVSADPAKAVATDYFKDSNIDLRKWFAALRNNIVKNEHRIVEPPGWVGNDARIKSRLGMQNP